MQHRYDYAKIRGRLALLVASLSLFALMTAPAVQAQEVSNSGKDFILAFLPNHTGSAVTQLHLTADVETDVTVQYPVNAPTFTTTVTVTPGTIEVVNLPTTVSTAWTANSVQNNLVRAFADDDFVVYMANLLTFTSDAALGLPVSAMNVDYVVMTYNAAFGGGEFAVYAAFDNTEVTITPSNNLEGRPAGVPFSVSLNRGEGYHGRSLASSGALGSLAGTTITATRPVGVSNGNVCTQVPSGTPACDHVFQIAHPTQTWGQEIPVANLPNRANGSIYRILASENDTEVFRDGVSIGTIDRGQFIETAPLPGDHVFSSPKPIMVTQFMTGVNAPGAVSGDPAMGNMIPSEQYLNSYTFSTVGGSQFAQHYLTVIAQNADIGSTMRLDGELIASGEFSPIAGTTLSVARLRLTEGTHTTSSASGHGITVQGYNSADSYLYPGGARFEFITGADQNPPICAFDIDGDEADGTVRDDRPDDAGVFFVRLAEGSENVQLAVESFEPGAPLVHWRLSLIDSEMSGAGTVVGIDGSGNQCRADVVFERNGVEPGECDDLLTLPSWDGVIHSNGDGTGYLIFHAPQGLTRAHFYNTYNLQTDLSAEGFVEDEFNNWVWDGNEGEEPTEVTVQLETIDKTTGQIRFWVRLYDTCPRWVDLDPETDLGAGDIPTTFALEQNYPNPFNPATTITFHVPEASHVTLTVFDVLGREVMRLVDGQVEAGTHTATWHGTSADGAAVSSGMYLYRLEAGSFSRTQAMSLVK